MIENNNNKGSKGYLFSIVLVAVIGGLLFGYDTAVISGAEKGLQAFFMGAKDFVYTDFMHGITSSSALIGCVIGAALSGICASRLGRRKSLIMAGVFFFLSALGSYNPEFLFFEKGAPTFSLLVTFNLYRVLGGVGVGLASAICPMYIAEVAPSNLRGTLVSWNQFAIIFGQLVVYFVNFIILGDHIAPAIQKVAEGINQIMNPGEAQWMIETGWRYMFVSEAVPAGLFTVLLFLVPETPRYLAMTGKDDQALAILTKINGSAKAAEILAEIKATVSEKTEKLFTYGWLVIFVGIMLSVFQQAVGINAVLYFAPRIFESLGMGNPYDADCSHGYREHHVHPRGNFYRREVGPQASAHLGIARNGSRCCRCSCDKCLCFASAGDCSNQHHGLQRVIHVQLGTYLLGAHLGDLP